MTDVCLGFCPAADADRDAIHVAVIPMRASELLRPGQRVGVISSGVAGPATKIVGIVDPYLTDVVPKGGRFWLCLLPGAVTGMRHHWSHPEFAAQPTTAKDAAKDAAEAWLREQCSLLGCDFDDLVSPESELVHGGFVLNGMNESARDHWYDIADEFWQQHEIYTGFSTPEPLRGGFTCSC